MKLRMTVGTQIFLGFCVLLMLILLLGVLNIRSFLTVQKGVDSILHAKFFNLLEVQHRRWNHGVATLLLSDGQKELKVELDHTKCRMGKFLYEGEAEQFKKTYPALAPKIEALKPVHKDLHDSAREIGELWSHADERHHQEALQVYENKTNPALEQITGLLNEMGGVLEEEAKGSAANLSEAVDDSLGLSWGILGFAFVGGLALALWLTRSIKQIFSTFVNEINNSASQVAAAAGEISNGAHQVSKGAIAQAASLEQTSSAMEQVSAQSTSNADHAEQTSQEVVHMGEAVERSHQSAKTAAEQARKARENALRGVESMDEISTSMAEIEKGSERIADIIILINEITHQTKMLATNAAIEAARAGEQGKGFAVVADEVSKLAESSKSSAKEISTLIKSSVEMTKKSADYVKKGETVLREIFENSNQVEEQVHAISEASEQVAVMMTKVRELVLHIKNASEEQAKGVGEVNEAIRSMDQVTQSNAANAEESASAAEQLNAQAQALESLVLEVSKVFGVILKATGNSAPPMGMKKSEYPSIPHQPARSKPMAAQPSAASKPLAKKPGIKASQAIPMKDDFRDF